MSHFDWDESQSYDYQLSNEFFTNEFNLKIHHVIFRLGMNKCYISIGMNLNPMIINYQMNLI
jgi:hypothetical protein